MSQDEVLDARKFSSTSENLARGQTYMAITDGKGFKHRLYQMAGRGRPDRTRMSFNALTLGAADTAGGNATNSVKIRLLPHLAQSSDLMTNLPWVD